MGSRYREGCFEGVLSWAGTVATVTLKEFLCPNARLQRAHPGLEVYQQSSQHQHESAKVCPELYQ